MSFYRKYRPQVIDEIDNLEVRDTLLGLLTKAKKELPHAFLFFGPRGAGKTTAARLVAKLLNCQKPGKQGVPCGVCDQCTSIANGSNLDVLELDAASNRGIDEIRTLRENIGLTPSHSLYKVYIIDEVHMLTTEAFNALLKTLEEPPEHAVFVLATTDPQKVPVTVRSRCVNITFGRATDEALSHALARIIAAEKLTIDEPARNQIIRLADGSFRDAVKLLEQVSFHKGPITEDVVVKELSISNQAVIAEFVSAFARRDVQSALKIIDDLVKQGRDAKGFLTDVLRLFEHTLVELAQGKAHDPWDKESIIVAIRILSLAYSQLRFTAITWLPLELAVVEYCQTDTAIIEVPIAKSAVKSNKDAISPIAEVPESTSTGLVTLAILAEHWKDIIFELNGTNHSVAGVLRSTRPKSVEGGIVTIEAFYQFHKDRLTDVKAKEAIIVALKKLFGEKVKVEIVLGKK